MEYGSALRLLLFTRAARLQGIASRPVVLAPALVIGIATGARVSHLEKSSSHVGADEIVISYISAEHAENDRAALARNRGCREAPMLALRSSFQAIVSVSG
jgi:hypothetical protein